jgi:hypothetical protein
MLHYFVKDFIKYVFRCKGITIPAKSQAIFLIFAVFYIRKIFFTTK